MWCVCRSFVLVYQRGLWYSNVGWRRVIGSRLPVLPIHIPVWYPNGFTRDQFFHPVIKGEKKEGDHMFLPLLYPM